LIHFSFSSEKGSKRAANNDGSIRQRSDGRWEARITIGHDPGTGKIIRRSVYEDTQAEVRAKKTTIQKELDSGTYKAPDKVTVADWMTEWLTTFCANKVKPLIYQSYEGIINNHIIPAIGSLRLQSVNGSHIQKMYNAMTKKGLSSKTIKNVSAVMHKAFGASIKLKMIANNPCDGAELPKAARHEITPLTDEEIPKFLEAIDNSPMRNAYALCLFTGLREGECLGLSWGQVDFQRGKITISQQLQKSKKAGGEYYIAPSTKSGKPRTIEPPTIAFNYLEAERVRQIENRLKAGPTWNNPDDLVFTNETGGHLTHYTFYRHFKKIAASIGRPDARPHDLRHTAATVAIASGADIKSVQDMLGHATASFTLNVYAHTSEQMIRDTADRVQGYYDGLKLGSK